MVSIRLPDGSSRSYDHPVTVAEVAASIGPGLAKAAVAGRVDGKVVDTSYRIERDAEVSVVVAQERFHASRRMCAERIVPACELARPRLAPERAPGFVGDSKQIGHVSRPRPEAPWKHAVGPAHGASNGGRRAHGGDQRRSFRSYGNRTDRQCVRHEDRTVPNVAHVRDLGLETRVTVRRGDCGACVFFAPPADAEREY